MYNHNEREVLSKKITYLSIVFVIPDIKCTDNMNSTY